MNKDDEEWLRGSEVIYAMIHKVGHWPFRKHTLDVCVAKGSQVAHLCSDGTRWWLRRPPKVPDGPGLYSASAAIIRGTEPGYL